MGKFLISLMAALFVILPNISQGIDTPETRATLSQLKGVYLVIEDLQPNIAKHKKLLAKAGLDKESLQAVVEEKLKAAGLKVMTKEEWLKTPGRPILSITINTHESEKYKYAYDVNVQLMQVVFLEVNPQVRTMSPTWSINITGMTHIGNLQIIKLAILTLIDRFISSWKLGTAPFFEK